MEEGLEEMSGQCTEGNECPFFLHLVNKLQIKYVFHTPRFILIALFVTMNLPLYAVELVEAD